MAVSNKQYWAIKNALSKAEKELIVCYEINWHLRQRVPTAMEVVDYLNRQYFKRTGKEGKLNVTSVTFYLNHRPVQKALDDRGIPWRQHSQEDLTEAQIAAAVVVANPADDRSIAEKLEELGVNPSQYQAWLLDPQFKNLVDAKAEQALGNIKPTAITEFTRKIQQGDWNALKYYMDATGAHLNNEAPQSEVLLRMIIEILQRHVKDPVTLMAIAKDIQAVSQNRTLEVAEKPALEGSLVQEKFEPEVSLEQATKMVGFG